MFSYVPNNLLGRRLLRFRIQRLKQPCLTEQLSLCILCFSDTIRIYE